MHTPYYFIRSCTHDQRSLLPSDIFVSLSNTFISSFCSVSVSFRLFNLQLPMMYSTYKQQPVFFVFVSIVVCLYFFILIMFACNCLFSFSISVFLFFLLLTVFANLFSFSSCLFLCVSVYFLIHFSFFLWSGSADFFY